MITPHPPDHTGVGGQAAGRDARCPSQGHAALRGGRGLGLGLGLGLGSGLGLGLGLAFALALALALGLALGLGLGLGLELGVRHPRQAKASWQTR